MSVGDRLAAILSGSLAQRPVLCDLISAQAAVLEHNISTEVALRNKHAVLRTAKALTRLIRRSVPELDARDAFHLVSVTGLTAGAAWPHSRPSESILAAYAADPTVAALRIDFADVVRETLEVTISGLLARHDGDRY